MLKYFRGTREQVPPPPPTPRALGGPRYCLRTYSLILQLLTHNALLTLCVLFTRKTRTE